MRMPRIVATVALAGIAVSGCTASRYQISDALMRYGLSANKADCASEFLRGRLSSGQVSRLSRAARYYNTSGPLTFGDLVRVAASIGDTQTTLQVGGAAVACGLVADMPLPRF